MQQHELILDFCRQFRTLGAENCFSNGMCYWFARILSERFSDCDHAIMYADIDNHFGCRIDNVIYDITGDVTNDYKWVRWADYMMLDRAHTLRLLRDCIYKLPCDKQYCATCPDIYMDDWGTYICPHTNNPHNINDECEVKKDE